MTAVRRRPIAEGVFTDEPRLVGSRCADCGVVTFPSQRGCPRCGSEAMERRELEPRGTLWTWTSQEFLPKEPYAGPETEATFSGYLLGYVELADGVMVETRLVDVDPGDVRIGMELELTLIPFGRDADGTEVVAYAFRPGGGGGASP